VYLPGDFWRRRIAAKEVNIVSAELLLNKSFVVIVVFFLLLL